MCGGENREHLRDRYIENGYRYDLDRYNSSGKSSWIESCEKSGLSVTHREMRE